jgi:hypothetical protein
MILDPDSLNPWRAAVLRRLAWPIIAFGVLVVLGGCAVLARYALWLMQGFDPGLRFIFSGLSPLFMGAFVIFLGLRIRRLPPDDAKFVVDGDSISPRQVVILRRVAWPLVGVGVLATLSGFGMLFIHFLALALDLDMEMDLPFRALLGFAAGAFAIFLGLRLRRLRPIHTGLFIARDSVTQGRAALLTPLAWPVIAMGLLTLSVGFVLLAVYLLAPMQDLDPAPGSLRALPAIFVGGFATLLGKELRRLRPSGAG